MSVPFVLSSPDADRIEAGRKLFAAGAEFVKGVVSLAGLPADDRIEVCFAGRSNVGKSSLINALTGRRALARASTTPGRTQEINFFALPGRYLVDLPGYGYARAPKGEVEKWQALVRRYLQGRASLRRAFVLVDSRHGIKPVDHETMGLLDRAAVPFQVVLTKADKIAAAARPALFEGVRLALQAHPAAYPEFVLTSAQTAEGIDILRASVADLA